jgi:hypothetical protein
MFRVPGEDFHTKLRSPKGVVEMRGSPPPGASSGLRKAVASHRQSKNWRWLERAFGSERFFCLARATSAS